MILQIQVQLAKSALNVVFMAVFFSSEITSQDLKDAVAFTTLNNDHFFQMSVKMLDF